MPEPTPFVHVPIACLDNFLPMLLQHQLPPELALKGPDLDAWDALPWAALAEIAAAGLPVALHAPFLDLSPASPDPQVRQITLLRHQQALRLAERLGAVVCVVHPGYDRWRFAPGGSLWHERSCDFWQPLAQQAENCGCRLALENIFETEPHALAALIHAMDSPAFGHCFDMGHFHLFAQVPLASWFASLGPAMIHLHLHDNHGQDDEHLPLGEGTIDVPAVFHHVKQRTSRPTLTLEHHSAERLLRGLKQFRRFMA